MSLPGGGHLTAGTPLFGTFSPSWAVPEARANKEEPQNKTSLEHWAKAGDNCLGGHYSHSGLYVIYRDLSKA